MVVHAVDVLLIPLVQIVRSGDYGAARGASRCCRRGCLKVAPQDGARRAAARRAARGAPSWYHTECWAVVQGVLQCGAARGASR